MNATSQSTTPQAVAFFNGAAESLCNLYGRWSCECEYENIDDYAAPLQSLAATHGVNIVKMTKRPFGVQYTVDMPSGEVRLFHATVNRNSCSYKRIG